MSGVVVGRDAWLHGLARSGLRAHLPAMAGTGVVLAMASALVTATGVLLESGLRAEAGGAGLLVTLVSSFSGTALMVVVVVVAATTTLALRGRRRELALLRAVGATRGQVRTLVLTEVMILSAVAAAIGAVPGLFLARLLGPALRAAGVVPAGFTPTVSPLPALSAVIVVTVTALLAGLIAARESVQLSPTAAIRASVADVTPVGPVRRTAAVIVAASGLAMAFTPLFLPGTPGSALSGGSAFLLIGAAALAGPLLVEWAFGRTADVAAQRGPVVGRLAVANLRGFARRLTTVVVPLALVLAVGTIQASVDLVIREASHKQLAAAIGTDRVATSPDGLTNEQIDGRGVVAIADVPAQVRTDDELPSALAWESTQVRVVPPDVRPDDFDPGISQGALTDLAEADTVAISSDAGFELMVGTGDRVDVLLDGTPASLRVVAVYDRGLGVGDYLVGPSTTSAHDVSALATTVLSNDASVVGLEALGATVMTSQHYVDSATSEDAAMQHLSSLLTMLLLVFVAIGAATTIVLSAAARRDELQLLHRSGATGRQLLMMLTVESLITGLVAWVIGTAVVVPGVIGVSTGLLGLRPPVWDMTVYVALSGSVIGLTVVATVLTAGRVVRAAIR